MNDVDSKTKFLAVLIYQDAAGWRCEEPRVYSVSHPEIAYQLALADGNEHRYGRTFLGLSLLEETPEEIEPIARSKQGDAQELVVSKSYLHAFNDSKWQGLSHDEDELRKALTEPDFLMELPGLDDIPWHTLTHAYGAASEVPKDLRRLASSDATYREGALWQLFGSIYHQGTLYPATEAATPFLFQILANSSLPDRGSIAELLESIAESASVDPAAIEKAWQWRKEHFGECYSLPTAEMAAQEIASYRAVYKCLVDNLELIHKLADDADTDVAKHAKTTIEHIDENDR